MMDDDDWGDDDWGDDDWDDDGQDENGEPYQWVRPASFMDGLEQECSAMARPVGAPQAWDDPAALLAAGLRFLKWLRDNPLYESRVFSAKEGLRYTSMPKKRAGTIQGLTIWLGLDRESFREYEKTPKFSGVLSYLRDALHQDKLEAAAADLLNPMIIMRDLGLQEQVRTEGEQRVHHDGSLTVNLDLEHDRERAKAEAIKRGLPPTIFDE